MPLRRASGSVLHFETATRADDKIGTNAVKMLIQIVCFETDLMPVLTFPGVLHFSFPLCCVTVRNHHRPGQRNSGRPYHQKEGPGQHLGELPFSQSKVPQDFRIQGIVPPESQNSSTPAKLVKSDILPLR